MNTSSSGLHRILDWRPRSAFARTLIVLLLVVPLAVAVAYMWTMWDPRHYLHDVKLAVVNKDTGAAQNGKQEQFGQKVAEGLIDTEYLNFEPVSVEEAEKGLVEGKYLFTVEIPEDFSQKVLTVVSDQPQQPVIDVSYNDYNGTNTPLLTNALVSEIQKSVSKGIQRGYAEQILSGMKQLGEGLGTAADGAAQLDNGATKLHDGTTQGVDGARQLKEGTTKLLDGSNQLVSGQDQILDGTRQLGDGMTQIDDGVGKLTDTMLPLVEQVQNLASTIQPMIDSMRMIGLNAQADQLQSQLAQLNNSNPENMAAQLRKLKDGTAQVRYNLTDPSSQYLGGMLKLNDGQHQLNDGIVQLDNGVGRLYDGTQQLNAGTQQLKDGTTQLSTGLSAGAAQAPKINDLPGSVQQMSVPIIYESNNAHAVQTQMDEHDPTQLKLNGGVSMILILVFGFLLMAVVAMLLPDVLGRMRKTKAMIPAIWSFIVTSVVNMIVLLVMAGVSTTMNWKPENWGAVLLVLALIAMTGAAVYQFFLVLFGRLVGGIFSLGFLGYGAFSFGGIWPLSLTPSALKIFHSVHPMSYARYAFVRATDGIIDSTFWVGIIGLVLSIVLSLALTYLVRVLRVRRNKEQELLSAQHTQQFGIA
ncbi:YhgE/Pip family protein [Corynebacterium sp. sy039]|uniref:YhgE/Pip family protein n=1 Tax=Corynebacterium sp. sy039 TaxID=2599641 RepID=UPI0011B41FC7|nr:YhgE/Pip family protein [Corynebacterium sp. sy039]QDZ43145.1 DUF3533 domain-containing protein [Corynebacterium sp. sy039]